MQPENPNQTPNYFPEVPNPQPTPEGTQLSAPPADNIDPNAMQEAIGGSHGNDIDPNQVNTVVNSGIKAGGKVWLWVTIAGIIATVIIVIFGAIYFFNVKGTSNKTGTSTNSASSANNSVDLESTPGWGALEGTELQNSIMKQILIESYGETKAKKIAQSSEMTPEIDTTLFNNFSSINTGLMGSSVPENFAKDFQLWSLVANDSSPVKRDITIGVYTVINNVPLVHYNTPPGGKVWVYQDTNINWSMSGPENRSAVDDKMLSSVNRILLAAGVSEKIVSFEGGVDGAFRAQLPSGVNVLVQTDKTGSKIFGFNFGYGS